VTLGQTLPNGLVVRSINRNETDYLYKEIFEDRIYTPPEVGELPADAVVVDVGANIGMFTLFAAQTWPTARIFAFEPVPEVFDVLCENVADLPNVTVTRQALGAAHEKRQLTYYPRYTMMSGFDADPGVDKALVHSYLKNIAATLADAVRREVFLDEAEEILSGRFDETTHVSCEVARLDSVAKSLGIDRIDFLKIDVEGFEVEVLNGIDDGLWTDIHRAAVEVEDDHGELAAVTELFTAKGMRAAVDQAVDYRGTSLYTVFASR
jgi:31-O-methyltransferase